MPAESAQCDGLRVAGTFPNGTASWLITECPFTGERSNLGTHAKRPSKWITCKIPRNRPARDPRRSGEVHGGQWTNQREVHHRSFAPVGEQLPDSKMQRSAKGQNAMPSVEVEAALGRPQWPGRGRGWDRRSANRPVSLSHSTCLILVVNVHVLCMYIFDSLVWNDTAIAIPPVPRGTPPSSLSTTFFAPCQRPSRLEGCGFVSIVF